MSRPVHGHAARLRVDPPDQRDTSFGVWGLLSGEIAWSVGWGDDFNGQIGRRGKVARVGNSIRNSVNANEANIGGNYRVRVSAQNVAPISVCREAKTTLKDKLPDKNLQS